jgi:zinc/manganese transport system permease protein
MGDFIGLLAAPFVGCLLIAALHCYMGLHVVRRGIIFVDLALAQLAALGATVALLVVPLVFGESLHEHHEGLAAHSHHQAADPKATSEDVDQVGGAGPSATTEKHAEEEHQAGGPKAWLMGETPYILSLLFAFVGAAIFALGRFRDERVPHEAIIGIVFVVSAALAVLVLSKAPHGHEQMESMLVGNILFLGWHDAWMMFLLYLPLGVLHFVVRRRLLAISEDIHAAESVGVPVRAWDFLFYITFGLMVTQSVRLAGVLVVFSYLIIPAVCASMLVKGFSRRLALAWGIAVVASVVGLALSAVKDLPTGPSLVATFGAILVLCALVRPMVTRLTASARTAAAAHTRPLRLRGYRP